VIVVGDSLLRGMEAPTFWPDALCREVCCYLGAHITDVTKRLSSLVQSTDCYPLLLFHVGTNDTQEQPDEYQVGLQSPRRGSERLWSAGNFLINPPGQREVWKGQLNLSNQQVATGLVPQPGVWLFRPWG